MIEAVTDLAGSIWLYPAIVAMCVVDGFFPPVPAEFVVVASASLAVTTHAPNLAAVMVCATIGAALGDLAAYTIGKHLGIDRLRRRTRIAAGLDRAASGLEQRTAATLLTARFVPFFRVGANMAAGALRLDRGRFVPVAMLSAACWSVYNGLIGLAVGPWLSDHPIAGVAFAIAIALTLGTLIDRIARKIATRRHSTTGGQPEFTARRGAPRVPDRR